MQKTLISFIIPTYNTPQSLLDRCVQSILRLSLSSEEREIIIVDDGSTAPPLAPAETIMLSKEHAGVSEARNLGLDHATGRYIQFVDADDMLYAEAYNLLFEQLRSHQPDCISFCMLETKDSNCLPASVKLSAEKLTGQDLLLHHNLHGAACSYVFSRDLIGRQRFTPGISYGEDEEFVPRILLGARSVWLTQLQAYLYIKGETSVTEQFDEAHVNQRLGDALHVIDNLQRINAKHLTRRIHQLAMDLMINTARLTGAMAVMNSTVSRLRQRGLFPLPLKAYTLVYLLFALGTRCQWGRVLTCKLLHRR